MRRIKFRPEVEDDIEDARVWYETQRAGLGDDLCERVDEAFERIRRMASVFATVYGDIRALQVERFPYAVYYRVQTNHVEVIAVMHTSRDPQAWKSRLDDP